MMDAPCPGGGERCGELGQREPVGRLRVLYIDTEIKRLEVSVGEKQRL